ncbi:MAG: lipoate-protein ligase A [Bacteroidia bacterium]
MDDYIIIDHDEQDPYFNLAAEEYLLHHFDENIIFLYDNNPCVVLGKHQNAFDECQVAFCALNGIEIIRRLSGGGTVFHGPGNLNFTFIKNGKDTSKLIDFKKHLVPVNAFLHGLNIPSEFSGRNDLLVDGYKVSGNAEHIYNKKKRVIHHGTLLYDADLKSLNQSIAPKTHMAFTSHAVKSVRSRVNNLIHSLPKPLTFKQFKDSMFHFLMDYHKAKMYQFTPNDITAIKALAASKYQTWDWNFGYSPKFNVQITEASGAQFDVHVVKGLIEKIDSTNNEINARLQKIIGQSFTTETFQTCAIEIVF